MLTYILYIILRKLYSNDQRSCFMIISVQELDVKPVQPELLSRLFFPICSRKMLE